MNFFELGCASLELSYLKPFMDGAGVLGRGFTAPAIGTALLAYGYYSKNTDAKNLGLAVLVALAVTALTVNLLKFSFQLPRPTPRSGYGFPSGDSSTAFTLAASLGVGYPTLGPIFFFLATLTSVCRLYFRAHFVWDVVGGAVIGIICGQYSAKRFLGRITVRKGAWAAWPIWAGTAILAGGSGVFFLLLEAKIAEHKHSGASIGAAQAQIDFGTPLAQPYLRTGWSENKKWREPPLTINWVEGRNASLILRLDSRDNFLLRFHAYPYRPTGFLCQRSDVTVNNKPAARIYLEQDWNNYEIYLPKEILVKGENRVEFHFLYSSRQDWHGINPGRKSLSVAFDVLQLISAEPHDKDAPN